MTGAIRRSRTNALSGQQVRGVRQVVDRLVRDGTAVARSDGAVHTLFPVGASAAEGEALRDWVVREGAARTVEVGLGYGISALHVCEGLLTNGNPNARHVVVDPNQATRFAGCGLQFLDEAGVGDLVEHHTEESQIVLPRLLSEGGQFDLAFVDGNHRFERVFVDDYQLPSVGRAVAFFVTNLGWTIEEVSAADELHQWAVLRTSIGPDTRSFDHFVEF